MTAASSRACGCLTARNLDGHGVRVVVGRRARVVLRFMTRGIFSMKIGVARNGDLNLYAQCMKILAMLYGLATDDMTVTVLSTSTYHPVCFKWSLVWYLRRSRQALSAPSSLPGSMSSLPVVATIVQGISYIDNPIRRLLAPSLGYKIIVSPTSVIVHGADWSYGSRKDGFKAVEILYPPLPATSTSPSLRNIKVFPCLSFCTSSTDHQ
jgi:hypothetical protein